MKEGQERLDQIKDELAARDQSLVNTELSVEEGIRIWGQLARLETNITAARSELDRALNEIRNGSLLGIRFGMSGCIAILREHTEPIVDQMTIESGQRRRKKKEAS